MRRCPTHWKTGTPQITHQKTLPTNSPPENPPPPLKENCPQQSAPIKLFFPGQITPSRLLEIATKYHVFNLSLKYSRNKKPLHMAQ